MKAIDFTYLKILYAQLSRWAFPLLAVILILSLRECRSNCQAVTDLALDLDSVARQAVQIENARGQLVAENKQLQATNADQVKELTDNIFALKKQDAKRVKTVQEYARIIQRFETAGKLAPFLPVPKDTGTRFAVLVPAPCQDSNYVKVPRPFMYLDSTITFRGRVTRVGVWLDSIRVENTLHYRTMLKKTGFLNLGRSTTVQVLNTNPAITTLGVTSIVVPHRMNWWNRWGKSLAAGILAGVAVDRINR